MTEEKKTRRPNFEEEELVALANAVKENYGVLFGKFEGSKVSTKTKNQAWIRVRDAVNAAGGNNRSVIEVKIKHKNLKTNTKRIESENRREYRKTGGGKSVVKGLTESQRVTLETIPPESIVGIPGGIDVHERRILQADSSFNDDSWELTYALGDDADSISSTRDRFESQISIVHQSQSRVPSPIQGPSTFDASNLPADYPNFEEFTTRTEDQPNAVATDNGQHSGNPSTSTIAPRQTTYNTFGVDTETPQRRATIPPQGAELPFKRKHKKMELSVTETLLQKQVELFGQQISVLNDIRELIRERNEIDREKLEIKKRVLDS